MKRFLFSLLLCLSAFTQSKAQSLVNPGEAIAERAFTWISQAKGDSLLLHATPKVKEQITAPIINSIFKQLEVQMGPFKSKSAWNNTAIDAFTIYHTNLHFNNQSIGLNITIDKEEKIAGFFLVPATDEHKK